MISPRILILEDETPIRDMLRMALTKYGYRVIEAIDTNQARECLKQDLPDLLLVDWMLPGESGVEFVRQIKRNELTRDIPVIMVTARVEEDDRVRGLEVGADDYVCKPFSPKELVARINAVLRRSQPQLTDEPVECEGLRIEPSSHRVFSDDTAIEMGPTEFRILHFFMTHTDRVYSRSQILDLVWGSNVYIEERTVDVHIRRLRKVLAPTGHDRLVQTVRGTGYRFSVRA